MHTTTYKYTQKDKEFSELNDPIQSHILYNSDLSGEVIIQTETDNEVFELRMPGWMLVQFVGEYINHQLVSQLEGMDGKQTLDFLRGL